MANKKKNSKNQPKSPSKLMFWVIGIIAAFLLGVMFIPNLLPKPVDKTKPKEAIDYSNEPFLGNKSAPVSIIEFGDYKCPNCKNFAENIVPIIQKDVIDPGKAKFYFFNDSFINDDSITAAKFAESVYAELGNDTFWKFHELLYKNQPEDPKYEKMNVYDEKFLVNVLNQVANANDVKKVTDDFEAKKSDAAWKKDMNYAEKLGVSGTPTIFINGKLFDGKTMQDLINMVDSAAKQKGNGNE